jgi:hypothetical protein
MNDEVRFLGEHSGGKTGSVGDIPFRKIGDHDLMTAKFLLQSAAEHPFAAGYDNLHRFSLFQHRNSSRCGNSIQQYSTAPQVIATATI